MPEQHLAYFTKTIEYMYGNSKISTAEPISQAISITQQKSCLISTLGTMYWEQYAGQCSFLYSEFLLQPEKMAQLMGAFAHVCMLSRCKRRLYVYGDLQDLEHVPWKKVHLVHEFQTAIQSKCWTVNAYSSEIFIIVACGAHLYIWGYHVCFGWYCDSFVA